MSGFADASGQEMDPLFRLAGAGGVIIAALLAIYFSWRFFVSVDEVEVADNLWGSLIGFYAYAMLLPGLVVDQQARLRRAGPIIG